MPRDPNIPDEFQVYTLCLLRRPKDAPQLKEEWRDELQTQHLAYRAELRQRGVLVANGPFREQTDVALRGLSIFTTGLEETARLNDGDPMVKAGWLGYDLMEWWVASGTLAFPNSAGEIGDRRVMEVD
ncbi:MAG TPA: YciI family protein [Candidatus Limnocylindrales bacterium]|jgi:uncharacterized protein YciI